MTLFANGLRLLRTPSKWLLSVETPDLVVLGGLATIAIWAGPLSPSEAGFTSITLLALGWVVVRLIYRWDVAQKRDDVENVGSRTGYYAFGIVYVVMFFWPDFEQRSVLLNFVPILAFGIAVLARVGLLGPLIPFCERASS